MARPLSSAAATAAALTASHPVLILRIDFGGSIGTKYFSGDPDLTDVADELRVLSWGALSIELEIGRVGAFSTLSISLADHDHQIKSWFSEQGASMQRKPAVLYRYWIGEGLAFPADAVVELKGYVSAPLEFAESSVSLLFHVKDASRLITKTIGRAATKAIFSQIPAENIDRILPLVFGNPCLKVPGLLVEQPGFALLAARYNTDTDNEITIDRTAGDAGLTDARNLLIGQTLVNVDPLPAATATKIKIGGARQSWGAGHVAQQPNTGGLGSSQLKIFATDVKDPATARTTETMRILICHDGSCSPTAWRYFTVTAWSYNEQAQVITVTISGSDIDKIKLGAAWRGLFGGAGVIYFPGTPVYEVGDSAQYRYIVCGLPCKSIDRVWVKGRDFNPTTQTWVEGFFELPAELYTKNTSDNRWSAASQLGHNVATVNTRVPPRQMHSLVTSDVIWADVRGIEDVGNGTGAVIDNPAMIALELLSNPNIMGIDQSLIDVASFQSTASFLSSMHMAFAITEQQNGLEFLGRLAFEGTFFLFFDQGKAVAKELNTNLLNSVFTLDQTNILEGSFSFEEADADTELITRIVAKYRIDASKQDTDLSGPNQREIIVANTTIEDAGFRREETFEFELWQDRNYVESIAQLYLRHFSTIWRHFHVSTTLVAIKLQPADIVTLNYVAADGTTLANTQARIVRVVHEPEIYGQPPSAPIIRLTLDTAAFVFAPPLPPYYHSGNLF